MNRDNLHDYQRRAVDFVKQHTHCACLLDMGLGKSVITLTAVADLIDNMDVRRVLVIAPKKVAETTWTDEASKWDHLRHLRVSRVMGTEKQRREAVSREADVYVVGRDSFVWLVRYHNGRIPYDMVVIDELTSFKSPSSQRFKAFRLIRTQPDRIVGLTGTPAPNGYEDLFAQIYCLDGGQRLGKYITHFRSRYLDMVMSHQGYALRKSLKPGAKEKIDEAIRDICIAMRADDYIQLPARQDIEQLVELPPSVKKQYSLFERDMVLSFKESGDVSATSAAALMLKLLQYANGAVYNDDRQVQHIHDEKLAALEEIVEGAQSPVLVFYQFIHDKARILDRLSRYRVRVYEGEQDLRDWNDGRIDVLLAHPASCSYGLNLQRGGHVCVWFGVGWNLELFEQANARLHRQGQQHTVYVYLLLARGTVDERVLRALRAKTSVQDSLMETMKELLKQY